MNRILSLLAGTAALAALVVAASPARAATTTANVNVTAKVDASCTMTDASVNFGVYNPVSATANDASGNLTVTCTKGTPANVTLAGAAGSRVMTDAVSSDTLPFELYTDIGRSTVWAGTTNVSATSATGTPVTVPVYGRIAAGKFVTPGTYNATVVATLNF